MSLRSRVMLGGLLMTLVLILGAVIATQRQRSNIMDQLDDRLDGLVIPAQAAARRLEQGDRTPRALVSALSDVWIGEYDSGGRLVTLISPTDDPDLLPLYPQELASTDPSSHATVSGTADTVRIRMVSRSNGRIIVVGLSTRDADRAIADLRMFIVGMVVFVLALLGLMTWWIVSLGISPITRMTEAAREIAGGDVLTRVPEGGGSTESKLLAAALNLMLEEVRDSERRIKQFLADASHELRTPLTTLRGYTDLYESGILRDEAEISDAMRRIRTEADRMNRIVTDLLALRNSDHELHLTSNCRLDEIVSQCVRDMRVVQPLRDIHDDLEAVTSTCDRQAITQCVMALGMNALEHTPVGTSIVVLTRKVDAMARFEITDTGPGIAPEHMPRIFERLYRVDHSRHGSTGHSGIGLSIVASVINAHGGRYGVESSPGVGSTFWFEIPTA